MKCPNDLCLVTRVRWEEGKEFLMHVGDSPYPIILTKRNYRNFCLRSSTKTKDRKNYGALSYETSWEINVSRFHTILHRILFFFFLFFFLFCRSALKELFRSNFPSHQLLALLHKFSSLLNESRNQKRYLNFYTQLIWEWLFKRDVYNTIPTKPPLSQCHGAAHSPFSATLLPLLLSSSHCLWFPGIMNSWEDKCEIYARFPLNIRYRVGLCWHRTDAADACSSIWSCSRKFVCFIEEFETQKKKFSKFAEKSIKNPRFTFNGFERSFL